MSIIIISSSSTGGQVDALGHLKPSLTDYNNEGEVGGQSSATTIVMRLAA